MRKLRLPVAIAIGLTACGQNEDNAGDSAPQAPVDPRPVVYAVNYPLAWMAERLGGDAIRVEFPAPADEDPAYWQPTPDQIIEFQNAALILLNGAGYAGWVEEATLPNKRLIDTTRQVRVRLIRDEDEATHSHGPDGYHSHGDWAFTTWLDPTMAIAQASAIRDAFVVTFPELTEDVNAHYTVLERDLKKLDAQLKELLSQFGDEPLLFSHPVYQYLERRYLLNARSVHWEPDQVPGDADIAELREILAEHPAKIMLWEDYLLQMTVDLLEAEGVRSLVFRTANNRPDEGDYLNVMRDNVANLEKLREESVTPPG
ncbi:MAG: metal ABC transporter substrate-binding protein [Gammaproteobacteria bacterium]|nr:metal ABC transporter substrate-binding protein [Gammaproteobacteria bacterium]